MNSKQIKTEIAARTGIAVKVRTINSSRPNGFIDAFRASSDFPEDFRRSVLAIVYGAEFAAAQSVGGNIQLRSISLLQSQWAQLLS